MDRSPEIVLFCAHRWEAIPFVELLGLKPEGRQPFAPVYTEHSGRFMLTLTGQGPQRAAAVVAAVLAGLEPDPARGVGNFGTAGASEKQFLIGQPYLVHRIRDAASARSFYPDRLLRSGWPEATCTTVSRIGQSLSWGDTLVDMELSGLITGAELFSSSAQIVAGKVVSDHLGESPPNWQDMTEAISEPYRLACGEFITTLEDLRSLLSENARTTAGRAADERVREALNAFGDLFTVTQSRRLETVLKANALSAREDCQWQMAVSSATALVENAETGSKKDRAALFDRIVETLQAANLFSSRSGLE